MPRERLRRSREALSAKSVNSCNPCAPFSRITARRDAPDRGSSKRATAMPTMNPPAAVETVCMACFTVSSRARFLRMAANVDTARCDVDGGAAACRDQSKSFYLRAHTHHPLTSNDHETGVMPLGRLRLPV